MDAFQREALARLPLTQATLLLLKHAADEQLLRELFQAHRGTGSEQKISFAMLVELIGNALLMHDGSGRQGLERARKQGQLDACVEAVYGKLRRVPVALSEAFLRKTAERLEPLLPKASGTLAPELAGHHVVVVDGKKLKNLPKRLQPLQGVSGRVLGGKVVVGFLLEQGLIVAMQASPDGEANDAPLTPGLLAQCQAQLPGRRLYVADSQFCDLKIPALIAAAGDHFLIRFNQKMRFTPEKEVIHDGSVKEAWGWFGKDPKRRMYLRQVTLERAGEKPVIVVTNLLDEAISAEKLLELYRDRWSIERVFQQLTEVFSLRRFIGSSPRGAVFQFALCSLLYNVLHVLRGILAEQHEISSRAISSELMFRELTAQFKAALLFIPLPVLREQVATYGSLPELRARLEELLRPVGWHLWRKSPPKKKRSTPVKKTPVRGGHSSAHKLIEAARAAKAAKAKAAKAK